MPAEPTTTWLTPHTAAFLQPPGDWFLNNAGWLTGPDGLLLIDTCATETRSRRLLAAARAANPDGPLAAALTHAHGDHANGAGLIARTGGRVLATDAATRDIASGPHTFPDVFACSTWGDITPPSTIEPITTPAEVDLGSGRVAEVIPVPGVAHTKGDLVVWLPREGVLFAGDLLFDGVTPLALQGSVTGWLAALDWISQFDAARIVPGHGPLRHDPSPVVAAVRDYLRWLLDVASEHKVDQLGALADQARERWLSWLDPERHAANLAVAHAETHDYPGDQAAALGKMLAAAGGRITLDI